MTEFIMNFVAIKDGYQLKTYGTGDTYWWQIVDSRGCVVLKSDEQRPYRREQNARRFGRGALRQMTQGGVVLERRLR